MKKRLNTLLLVIASSLIACAAPDEEKRLGEALAKLVDAVEERSVRQVQKYLSNDFKTDRHTNTQQIKSYMLIHFRQNPVIHVFTSDVQITMQQEKADMEFNALVTGSSSWLPERGRRFSVKSRWLKQDGDWKLSRLSWQEKTALN